MAHPRVEPGTETEHIGFRVPATLLSAVDELAAQRGEDRSAWVRRVLAEHIAAQRADKEAATA